MLFRIGIGEISFRLRVGSRCLLHLSLAFSDGFGWYVILRSACFSPSLCLYFAYFVRK